MNPAEKFRDNCGFGLLAQIDNQPSHQLLKDSIKALKRMMHRGAIVADGKTGDGSGLGLFLDGHPQGHESTA